jgi:hypothetical protein
MSKWTKVKLPGKMGTVKFPGEMPMPAVQKALDSGFKDGSLDQMLGLPDDPASRAARMKLWGVDPETSPDYYHGTLVPELEGGGFDVERGDLGTHMGTAEQASNRIRKVSSNRNQDGLDAGQPNIMPLKARTGKSLEMEDVGAWEDSFRVIESLKSNMDAPPEIRKWAQDNFNHTWEERSSFEDIGGEDGWYKSPENREMLDEVRSIIEGAGYDSVRYKNAVENEHGMSAGLTPAQRTDVDDMWRQKQTIYDAEKARRPDDPIKARLDELWKDPNVTSEMVEEAMKQGRAEVNHEPSFTPEEQAQLDGFQARQDVIDKEQSDNSYSMIVLDPANIRSKYAEFDPKNEGKAKLIGALSATAVALGAMTPEEAEAGILRPASMNVVNRLVQLGMLGKPDSPQAVKSALKRYNDNMKSSKAFAEREAKAAAGEFQTDFERTDLGERTLISPESVQGNYLAAVRGDPSDIGTLRSNAGVALPRDVRVDGGNRFSQRHAEDSFGWASAPEVATGAHSKLQQIQEATGGDVTAIYNRMGDDSTNFSTPIAEAMHLEVLDNKSIAKKDKAAFDKTLRKSYKDWVGLDHPDALAQLMGWGKYPRVGKMRTAYTTLMGQDAFLKRGFPAYKPLIEGTKDIDLAGTKLGDAGLSLYTPDTSRPAAAFDDHGTYEYQMPGDYLGGFGSNFDFETVFPKSFEEQTSRVTKGDAARPLPRAEKNFTREQAIDAINKRTDQYELADQEWVDNIMPQWEARQNPEAGNADPRLLAGVAGLGGLAAAAGSQDAEALPKGKAARKLMAEYGMDQQKIADAEAMGFNTDEVFWRGGAEMPQGGEIPAGRAGGVYFSPQKEYADSYGEAMRGVTAPYLLREGKSFDMVNNPAQEQEALDMFHQKGGWQPTQENNYAFDQEQLQSRAMQDADRPEVGPGNPYRYNE